jgi:hypothetical protein
VTRLKQLISAKDATIKELRASKKTIAQELETAQLAAKTAEETAATLKAQRDKAMDKAIRAGRILMRRPGVVVPEDIKANVHAAPDSSKHCACHEHAVSMSKYSFRGHQLIIRML